MTETSSTKVTKKPAATRKPFSLEGVITHSSSRAIKAPERLANQAPEVKVVRKKSTAPVKTTTAIKKKVEKKKAASAPKKKATSAPKKNVASQKKKTTKSSDKKVAPKKK
ncbi:hypothetical protein RB653_002034 [Dictyostelium firmibasis]|uniref:Uncharacterized protein n=1 Tax=Dictyostelium firmibasis TaxID=79012 RepID=A0AAN7YPP2_9MYCE